MAPSSVKGFGMSGKPPPDHCCDCKAKLPSPQVIWLDRKPTHSITCKCGVQLIWAWPKVWVRMHLAGPLFTDRRVIQTA